MIGRDQIRRRVKLERVVVEVGDETAELTRANAASVPAQLNGVEVVAKVGQVVGDVGLEEIVVPAVEVQRCPRPDPWTRPANQRCNELDVVGLAGRRLGTGQSKFGRLEAAQEVRTPGGHPPIVPKPYLINRMLTGYL